MARATADPDTDMRAWLRSYASKHPCHGFRRAWATLRYDEGREVNKKIHRLWREEGLQVKVTSPRKRAGVSSIPPVEADAPKVVWVIDFQFDSTIDGKAIKIASMIDEHTRVSLLNIVERSITADRLVQGLKGGELPQAFCSCACCVTHQLHRARRFAGEFQRTPLDANRTERDVPGSDRRCPRAPRAVRRRFP
jgi:HTH-like domain